MNRPLTAQELRRWRSALGWPQPRAAAWLQVKLDTYQNWEQGRRQALHPGALRARMSTAKQRVTA